MIAHDAAGVAHSLLLTGGKSHGQPTQRMATRSPDKRGAAPDLRVPLAQARAHWYRIQGLEARSLGALEELVAATGWLRTLGGIDAWLALRERRGDFHRADGDEAVLERRLQVLPAVRGCIYLVPSAHAALALRVAAEAQRGRLERELERAGTSRSEVEETGSAILATLAAEPLTADALRRMLPAAALRSLGDRGKKVGLSSLLPPALRLLEWEGRIERRLAGGRLDSERYLWGLRSGAAATLDRGSPAAREDALVEIFFRHAGPAPIAAFAAWAGLTLRQSTAAVARSPLRPVAIEGIAATTYMPAAGVGELGASPPPSPEPRFLGFEDNFLVLHGGPGLYTDVRHHARPMEVWGSSKRTTLGAAKHVVLRTLFEGDRLSGFWEFDPRRSEVTWATLDPCPAARRRRIAAQAEALTAFIRDEAGHGKCGAIDSEDDLARRADQVRALAR